MLGRLILLFCLLPLIELILLVELAARIDWPLTVGLVLVTGVLGAGLARREGLKTVQRIQSELGDGRMPTDSLWDGAMILVAGAVLITPGMITDLMGFALLIPFFRKWVRKWISRSFEHRVVFMQHPGQSGHPGQPGQQAFREEGGFIDVEAETHDPTDSN